MPSYQSFQSQRRRRLIRLTVGKRPIIGRARPGELTRTDIAQAETQLGNAKAQANLARDQLEQSRATYAALVGLDPGVLAPDPPCRNFRRQSTMRSTRRRG